MAGSYVNFYIANSTIVMPLLDDPRDAPARDADPHLPGRRMIGVQAREILLGGGGIHCITLHEPLGQRSQLGKDAVG